MKKYLILVMVLMLLLCTGCGKKGAEENQPAGSKESASLIPGATEGLKYEPIITYGTAKANQVPAILCFLDRDETVSLVGSYDNSHYVVKTLQGYGLVKKNLLRTEGQAAYEAWTGYAYQDAELYENLNLTGKSLMRMSQNTKVEVLDDLGYCYVVRVKDVPGFMLKSAVSKWYFSTSNRSGEPSQTAGEYLSLLSTVDQNGEVIGEATILADKTPVILGYFNRGDQIPVVTGPNPAANRKGYAVIYLEDLYTYVPEALITYAGDAAYEAWTGYSRWDGAVYDNFYCLGEASVKLHTNAQVQVVDELENSYVVIYDGKLGYVPMDMISRTWIATDDTDDNSSAGSDSGSSDSGSSSGSGSSGSDSGEWTPPVM